MRSLTIDGLALCQVAVILAGQEPVTIASNNALNVAIVDIEEKTFHLVGCGSSGLFDRCLKVQDLVEIPRDENRR
jgi:hypothetical protein